jgi:hypothetical protein
MASISSLTTTQSKDTTRAINILDRLVWIRYESHWWPAILYESYSEVQQHLYKYLDTILKAQFAMAIMLEMNAKKETMVARVLGRSAVELVEVEEGDHREFYWKLHRRIQQGCDISNYDGNVDLYRDFHRALDEVQQVFQRYARKQNFDLLAPDSSYKTWVEAAGARIEELGLTDIIGRDEDDTSLQRINNMRTSPSFDVTNDSSPVVLNSDKYREMETDIQHHSPKYKSDKYNWNPRNGDVTSMSSLDVFAGSSTTKTVRKGNSRRSSTAAPALPSTTLIRSDGLGIDDESVSTACGKESWPSVMKPSPSSRLKLGRARATKGNRKSTPHGSTSATVFE